MVNYESNHIDLSSSTMALELEALSCALWQNLAPWHWQGDNDVNTRCFQRKSFCRSVTVFFRSVEKQLKEQCDDGQAYCWMSCLDGLTNHISIVSMTIISIFIIEKYVGSSSKFT